jgi:hypothetical protein
MEGLFENRYVLYVLIFLCFLNLIADIAVQEFFFAFLFLLMIFLFDSIIKNKVATLALSLVFSNIIMFKFKYNQMKYYYAYLQSSPQKKQVPSYVM